MIDLSSLGIGGIGTEGFLGVVAYLLLRDLLRPKWQKRQETRKFKKDGTVLRNPNPQKPGYAKECIEHTKKLGQLCTKVDLLEKQNTKDHDRIFGLLNRREPRP